MNIESLGEGKVEFLYDVGLIKDVADLYSLTFSKLYGLSNDKVSFKEKTAQNIIDALEKSKSVPFERVLFALGIRNVGEVVAKTIVAEYHDIDSIIQASVEELSAINTVGEVIALSVKAFFENPVNLNIVRRLQAAGLQFAKVETPKSDKEQVLAGKTFVVSGVFEHYSRDGIKETIEAYGGKNVSSIGSKAFYNCKKLEKVTFKTTKLRKVGKYAFKGIKKNAKLILLKKNYKLVKKAIAASKPSKVIYKKK